MSKPAKAQRIRPRKSRQPAGQAGRMRWILVAGIAAAATLTAAVVWMAQRGGTDETAAPAKIEHIHGLGINPANGTLYAAAHNGVFTVPEDGPARRVGTGQQDTMGFTVAGPNHFLASGHPAAGQDGPKHLGLIESRDGGLNWQTISLAGQADFHALRFRHNTVYGYNSVSGQLMASTDRTTWQTRSAMTVSDVTVSPASAEVLLAAGQSGLVRSTDGGRTWAAAGGPPVLLLDWAQADQLWAVTAIGDLMRSGDGGTTWSRAGGVGGQATALAVNGDNLFVAVHGKGILHSRDRGATWTTIYS